MSSLSSSSSKSTFSEFDLARLPKDGTILLIGRRKSGKTNAAIAIMRHMRHNRVICLCLSPEADKTWRHVLHPMYIEKEFNELKWKKLLKEQAEIVKKIDDVVHRLRVKREGEAAAEREKQLALLKRKHAERSVKRGWSDKKSLRKWKEVKAKEEEEWKAAADARETKLLDLEETLRAPYAVTIIIDDCGSKPEVMKSEILKEMMDNGRHYILCVIVLVQKSLNYPPNCRNGIDFTGVFNLDPAAQERKTVFEKFTGGFDKYQQFSRELNKVLSRRGACLIFDKMPRTENIRDIVFQFNPERQGKLEELLGSKEFNDYAKLWYKDPDADKESKEEKKEDDDDDDEEEQESDKTKKNDPKTKKQDEEQMLARLEAFDLNEHETKLKARTQSNIVSAETMQAVEAAKKPTKKRKNISTSSTTTTGKKRALPLS